MSNITQAEAIKEIRVIAKKNGLIFKRGNFNINGKAGYQFVDEFSRAVSKANFWNCYADCMSGYIDTVKA